MPRPFPWKCRNCGEQKVAQVVVENYSAQMEHDGRAYSVIVPRLEVLECANCKTRILTDEAHKRIADGLRAEAGLLFPEEIHTKREQLHLTQKQLAAYLKVSDSTISRWETGGQIQQRAMDLLLRGFFHVRELRLYFAELSNQLPPAADFLGQFTLATNTVASSQTSWQEMASFSGTIGGRLQMPANRGWESPEYGLEHRPGHYDPSVSVGSVLALSFQR